MSPSRFEGSEVVWWLVPWTADGAGEEARESERGWCGLGGGRGDVSVQESWLVSGSRVLERRWMGGWVDGWLVGGGRDYVSVVGGRRLRLIRVLLWARQWEDGGWEGEWDE